MLTIWFQGCDIHCEGCCNPDMQPITPKNILTLDEIVAIIGNAKAEYGIEGVTYSGGEPTLQQNLPCLTEAIQSLGLGVISFTGHCYDEVQEQLKGCDAVLDGPYIDSKRDKKRKILGSENQRIVCLTDRYKGVIDDWFSGAEIKEIEVNLCDKIVCNGDKI